MRSSKIQRKIEGFFDERDGFKGQKPPKKKKKNYNTVTLTKLDFFYRTIFIKRLTRRPGPPKKFVISRYVDSPQNSRERLLSSFVKVCQSFDFGNWDLMRMLPNRSQSFGALSVFDLKKP